MTIFLQKDILAACCVVGYGLGLFYVTPGGQIMLEMVDYYGGTILILALASCEIIAFNWIYGTSFIGRPIYSSHTQHNKVSWQIFHF